MKLDITEQMLFALLRSALHGTHADATIFAGITSEAWQECYRLSVRQSVMALAWDGLITLPTELQPPKSLKINWWLAVERCEKRYRYYCRVISDLSTFYATHGITAVQLKGVGFANNYPIPSHREGGDIDIFTYSADSSGLSDREANSLADKLMRGRGIEVDFSHSQKHSMFYYKGIPIENHKKFLNTEIYRTAVSMDILLRKLLRPRLTVLDGKYEVLTPSPDFNTVFLAFHSAQHYALGFAMHHLCDWACLLKKQGLKIPEGVTDERFLNMIYALTHLCNRYLGTEVLVMKGGEELAENLLKEMLHPTYNINVPATGKWGILVYKLKRMLHIHRLCDSVMRVSLVKWLWISVIQHVRFPQSIFRRTVS